MRWRPFVLSLSSLLLLGAQEPTQSAVAEVSGHFGGAVLDRGLGHYPVVGVSGAAGTSRVQVYGEFNFVPMARSGRTWWFGNNVIVANSASVKVIDYGGGLQIALAVGSVVEPYLIAGFGAFRGTAKWNSEITASGVQMSSTVALSETQLRAGGGFGLRVFAGHDWGLNPEVRVDRYLGNDNVLAVRYSLGAFVRWGR